MLQFFRHDAHTFLEMWQHKETLISRSPVLKTTHMTGEQG